MNEVTAELARLIRAQQTRIHDLVDELSRPNTEGRHADVLDLLLDQHILIKDTLIETLDKVINIGEDDDVIL